MKVENLFEYYAIYPVILYLIWNLGVTAEALAILLDQEAKLLIKTSHKIDRTMRTPRDEQEHELGNEKPCASS